MWKVIQDLLPAVLIILVITQYIIPILLGTKTWWLFRPSSIKEELKKEETALNDEIESVKTTVGEIKTKISVIKEKVDEKLKSAEDLKKESDNLLK